jgi:serine/alanine adding enzyme
MHLHAERSLHPPDMLTVHQCDDPGAKWGDLIAGDPSATICHDAAWADIMRDSLGCEPVYLEARDGDGALKGILPLVRVRSRMFGHHLVSLPFLNSGGPLGTPEATAALGAGAVSLAERTGADVVELRSRAPAGDQLERNARKITVILPLPATAEELWSKTFRSKLRSQVRRPLKAGMEPRLGPREMDSFYEVFARTMRDLGTPVLPRAFFEAARAALEERVVFGAVYSGDRPVAAGCALIWRDTMELTWAGALREHNRESPNMLLYAAMMEEAIRRGISTFDFGRCTPGSGTHRFKRQWRGEDRELPWTAWSARTGSSIPTPDRPLFRLASAAWRRLPIGAANRIGPHLARRIP